MNKKRIAGLLSAALLVTLLGGCGPRTAQNTSAPAGSAGVSSPAAQKPGEGTPEARRLENTMAVGIASDLDASLDAHKVTSADTKTVLFNIFEGLVKPAPDGSMLPAVAEKWEVSEDHKTYTFTLREGITFHNGLPVTAEDVKWSLERVIAPQEADVNKVAALAGIESIDTPDDRTVVLALANPATDEFLTYLTVAIEPHDYAGQDTQPVGTGPFRFISRSAQDNVVLERFDGYWGTPARLDSVTYKIIENGDSILMSLQSGAVDMFAHLTTTQAGQLKGDFNIEEGEMNLVQALYLNNAAAPFDDVKVRQALCYAIDKDQIIDIAFDGYGFPLGSSMYPAFGKYFMDELTDYYPHDADKARALLAEAGYPNGFDMVITVPSNYEPHVNTAQVIVEQLKAVGISARIEPVDWGTWVNHTYIGRNFQSTVCGFDASYVNARALLERFQSAAGKNFINYNSPEYDALFAQVDVCYDDAEQTELYKALERDLTEKAANVYIQDLADLVAVRKGLAGLNFYPLHAQDLSTLGWEG